MTPECSVETEIIAKALLQVGERVMEVSRDRVITKVWDKKGAVFQIPAEEYIGRKFTEVRNDSIMSLCDEKVRSAFISGENEYIEYAGVVTSSPVNYVIRVLANHPDNDFLFVVFENLLLRKVNHVVEDKWKLALDASGDGVWDTNLETRVIFFSEKWQEIFGYDTSEIGTMDKWSAKIHPDDLPAANKKMARYLAGEVPAYSTEIRYLCKDGTYKWVLSRGVVVSRTSDGKPLRFVGTHTDITEQKHAEERYLNTVQLLAKLINNLQTSILVTDENWKVVFVNQVYYDLFAERGNPAELIGMDMKKNLEERKFSYKDPDKFYNRTVDIVARQQIVINDELEALDGRIISRDYIPLMLGNNNKGGIWKFKDITEQRNVENRFEEQRLFYERILNAIPADIAVFDKDHRYLFVNKNAFKKEDLRQWMIGKTDEDYARYSNRPHSFVEKRFALYDKAVQGGERVEFIEKLVSKDEKVGHHLRLMSPVFRDDGSLEFLMAYGLEITDLIVAQEELRTSIDTFASAFDHSGIGMALIGTTGRWLDVNKELCDLTGYSKEELLRLTYHDITFPRDDEMDRPLINQLLRKQISTYTIEKRYVSRDKKIVLVSLTVSLVWNSDDTPKFFIAQVVDITDKKELENSIARRNMELEATRVSLVNKIRQLEELSHIIAHNLRGPAGNVKMFSEILMAKQNSENTDSDNPLANAFTTEEAVKFIYESSTALMESLATLMEITEIKLNKDIPYNDCDIEAIVNGIITQLHSIIYEKDAVIKLDLELTTVKYPKGYFENILYNLVSNALKYSSTDVPPEIIVASRRLANGKTQMIVKDNGIGIDLVQFGEKVFKLNQTFHAGYDSKGIGLYITKTQVESLGGSIELKSKPNEGCEFIVTL
jgi:PAS domain S-box-containing protein